LLRASAFLVSLRWSSGIVGVEFMTAR